MVTVRPGLTLVPPDGLCRTTVFSLAVEAVAVLMCAFRLRSVSLVWAVSTSSPTTSGTVTCCWPDDTYTLTVELAGSIVPQPGSVLMTWSFATVGDGWSMRCGCRRASTIFCVALAYDRPVTCGTSWVLLLPPPRRKYAPAMIAATASAPSSTHSQTRRRRPPPPGGSCSGPYS